MELTSIPLGLMEDDDSLVRSIASVRQRNETERIFLSSHRPLTNSRASNISANGLSDIPEFSSTNDLTPLSISTFKDEKSQRIIWLDNASLMVSLTDIILIELIDRCLSFSGDESCTQ